MMQSTAFSRSRRVGVGLTIFVLLAISAVALLSQTLTASAATFVVNSTVDAVDADPGDGECATSAGECTLRAAVQEANALDGHDTIHVPAGHYVLALGSGVVDPVDPPEPSEPIFDCNLAQSGDFDGDLDITCPVTITGDGAGSTIIEAGSPGVGAPPEQLALDRLVEIHTTAGNVTISGLTLRGGYHPEAGGAVANSSYGTVRFQNVSVLDSATVNAGGGIYSGEPLELECPEPCAAGSPKLELINTTVSGNTAGNEGGGVYVQFGTLTVSGGTIADNQAASGGGVFNAGEVGDTGLPSRSTLSGTTVSGNIATGAGGGIFGDHEGSIALTNVTLSDNTSFDYGGGIAVVSKSDLTMSGGAVTGNIAVGEGGGVSTGVEGAVTFDGVLFSGNSAGKTLPSVEVPGEIAEGEGGGGGLFIGGSGPATVTNSDFLGNSATNEGGGIFIENNGSVTISDGEVANNTTKAGGGGIENAGRRVNLLRMDIHHNRALLDGGGIEGNGSGDFTISDGSIYANTAENGGGFANGADGATRVERTTIWNNRAVLGVNVPDSGLGGGIYGLGDATAHYENVTITGNFAQIRGGGLYIDADADVHVDNSTISRNVAPAASGVGDEATDFNVPIEPSQAVLFRNTIVAGNLLSPSCNFALGSLGGNLEDGDSCYFRGPRDRQNAPDPGLDAVADNGGPTMTMALRQNSFAIDGGVSPCSATDARGVSRPQNGRCDIGAFEYQGPFPPPDNEPPDTEYLTGPDQDTEATSAFTFTGTDDVTPPEELLFECRLLESDVAEPPEPVDPTEPPDPEFMWLGCPSPWQVELVEEGLYRFEVRAIDRAGNVDESPDVYIFGGTDDVTPPDTFFTGTPDNPSSGTTAVFGFSATDNVTPAQWMEYECRIDTGDPEAWLECLSPVSFSNLTSGSHTVEVRAADGNDNVDPTPAKYTWTVGEPVSCEEANITLFAEADTWIDETEPQDTFGIDTELTVRSRAGGENARALVRFAVPTGLPPECELQSARLRLYSEGETGRAIQAVPIANPWAETGVSWNTQPGTTGTAAVTTSGSGYREWDVTAQVVGMMAGDLPNHGFLIRDAAEGDEFGAEQGFTSRHIILEPPETQMPQLVLRFGGPETPLPPAPPAPTPQAVTCGQVITASIQLTNDLFDCQFDGLIIGADNVEVDLNGHTVDGLNYLLIGQEEGLPVGIRNIGHENVRIHNGTVQEFGSGVQLMAGARFTVVEDLLLQRNAIAGVELWDADDGRNGNTVRDNTFVTNGEAGVWLLSGTENSLISGNNFDGNAGVAIYLLDAHRNRIENNRVSGVVIDPSLDSDGGVLLESSSDNVVTGNILAETGDGGIVLIAGSHRNLIEGNVLTATGDAGVAVEDSDGNQVVGNIAHLGSDAGVVLNAANDGVVRDNDVRFNPTGVDLGGSSGNLIENNDADYSDGTGIAIGSGSLRNDVIGNSATNTAGDGISVEGEAVDVLGLPDPLLGNLIENNTTNGNLGDGINIAGVGHTITGNMANSNAGFGIAAAEDNFDGGGNTASGNGEVKQCVGVVCGPGVPAPPPTPDVTAPDTSFVSTPPNGHGMLETVSFTFTGTDNIAPPTALRFQCRLDAPPDDPTEIEPPDLEPPEPGDPDVPDPENWIECANPVTYYLLTTGDHKFEVRAIDPFDNVDLTPAIYEWTVIAAPPGPDSTAPNTTIFEGPSDPTTKTKATFRFSGSDNAAEGPFITYECRLDSAPFAPCTSPVTHTGLSLGEHSFRVRAIDAAGNVDASPALHIWTIEAAPPDTTAPETEITSGPDLTTISTEAVFTFSGSDPGADDDDDEDEDDDLTFECSRDGAAFAACESPVEYSGLAVGGHTFEVRAVDEAGNADPSPAAYAWTITAPPVATTVTCGQVLTQSTRVTNHLIDCPGNGLVIGAPNITVDLDGHTIDGTGFELAAGVRNSGFDSVTITNGVIQEFDFGVLLNPGTTFNIVNGLTLQLNLTAGIQLSNADDGANGNTLRFNTAAGNDAGIILTNGTQHAYVHDNTISGSSGFSIYLFGASGSRIEGNLVTVSSDAAINLEGSSNNLIARNTVVDASDAAVLIQLASNHNRVEENVITASDAGVHVLDSNGTEIVGNEASANSDVGITLENAHNGIVVSNDLRFNSGGIELSASSGNLIEANDASEGSGTGISVGDVSLNNVVVRNRADANDAQGIAIHDLASAGTGNLIDRNVTNNNIGGGIYIGNIGHIIAGNTANYNGSWGIYAAQATVAGGNIDGGDNTAIGNVGPLDPFTLLIQECFNVVCDGGEPVASDPLRPETWIIEAPEGDDDDEGETTSTSATFRFGGIDNATSVQFECRLNSTDAGDFADCTSPKTYTGLELGTHTFEVRAVDFLGNVDASPAVHTWTIIAEPEGVSPVAKIDAAPDGATLNTSATFAFSASEEDAGFECKLDGGAFAACDSPRTYTGLAVGSHTFQVRAIDADDLVSAPASFTWAVTPAPVPTAVTCGRVLTQSTLVTNDLLDCPNNGLVIGAHNITVDLNGHTIDGIMQGVGILNNGFDSVVITNGAVQEFDFGVQLNPGATRNVVSLLTLQTNEMAAIQLSDADNNTIRNHSLIGNGSGIALIAGTQNAVVRDNTMTTQAREGVLIQNAHGNRVEGNEISASSEDGILLEGSTGNALIDNVLSANAKEAISVTLFSHGTRVVGNVITGNAGGILVDDSNDNEIVSNVVTSNDGGIVIELSHGNVIRVNEVRLNSSGIELSEADDNLLEVNNASANSGPGIAVEGVTIGTELVQNVASGNDGEGIYVGNQAPSGGGLLIDRNLTNGNGGDGIFVAGGHTLTGNQADFNDGWGIYAEQGTIDAGGNNALGNSEPEQCFGIECEIGENPTAPNTRLLDRPTNPSNSRTATFTFDGTDDTTPLIDLDFECRLDSTDPLAWEECELPAIFTVSPGTHTFEVRAVDLAENVDPTPESYTWTYVPLPPGVPPDTIIEIAPLPATPMLEAIFKFSSNEPDVTFQCSMDGEPFTACANEPEMIEAQWFVAEYEFEEEQVGQHTFRVRAVDPGGLADPTPATHTWIIIGAMATITNGPAFEPGEGPLEPANGGETEETTATFEFHANVPDAVFECSLDLGVFQPCISGVTYTDLSPGEHLFFVMAIDPEGEFAQLEPTEYEWTVLPTEDLVPPDTQITDAPDDDSSQATFTFTGTDNVTSPAAMTFECRLDSTDEEDFVECLSPFNLYEEFPDLFTPGEHTFEVRANDNAEPLDPNSPLDGNVDPTPASYTWTSVADTTPPTVEILIGPDDPTLFEVEAEFTFTGGDDATPDLLLVFDCVVDEGVEGAEFEECESPYLVQGALPGDHTFQVRTVDLAGNVSTPDSYTWTVIGPPDTTITSGPDPATTETTATFEFEADQAGSTFGCSLNGSAFQACESPLTLTGLGGDDYTLEIEATNEFGLVEEDPAIWEWIVDAPADVTPPDTTILTGPDDPTLSTTAIFTFVSSELGSSFECGLVPLDPLEDLNFSSCESPIEFTDLLGGNHEFQIRAIDLAGNVDPTPAVYTWTVLGPPQTTIISGPEDETEETTATFAFVSSVPGATFMCALDVPPFVACTSPVTYTGLAVGSHEFVVFSIANGFADTEGDGLEWDILEPVALQSTFTLAPPLTTESTDATFEFVSSLPDSTFECSLDGAAFAACESPLNLTGLSLGAHTLAVRAIHPVDGIEPTPATYTWTVVEPDTTPPDTTITQMPANPAVLAEATFTFIGEDDRTTAAFLTFECRLDSTDPLDWSDCVSPLIEEVEIGTHTLEVRAIDLSLNVDPTPATYEWTVELDTTPPDTTITAGPDEGDTIGDTIVAFQFIGSDDGTLAIEIEFECRFDSTLEEDFGGCDSPHEIVDLTGGEHTFEVRAVDQEGNVDSTPASRTWTVVDVLAPETSLDLTPEDPTEETTATFEFSSDDPTATFACALDAGDFLPCASPHSITHVTVGLHTLQVRAVDPFDNADPEPELFEWTVVAPVAPDTTITAGPPAVTLSPLATFVFASDQPGELDFECSLDGEPFAGCESPHELENVPVGDHTLQVRAIDAADKVDPTPAVYEWTVDATPETTVASGPSATSSNTSATFTFTTNELGTTFECSLDGAAFAACMSPRTYTGLATGSHTFAVRTIDANGFIDPTPATYAWAVEPPPPPPPPPSCGQTTVSANADAWIQQNSPSDNKGTDSVLKVQSKGSSDNFRAVVRFNMPASIPAGCVVESATLRLYADSAKSGRTIQAIRLTGSWTENGVTWSNQPATTGPAATTASGSSSGWRQWDVTAQVQAMLAGGNNGFLIRDAVEGQDSEQQYSSREKGSNQPQLVIQFAPAPPQTSVETWPSATTIETTASFTFSANQTGSTFACSLDGAAFAACTSPKAYTGLAVGNHEFRVRATGPSGGTDPTPASYQWTVEPPPDLAPPETEITSGPAETTASSSALFTFEATEPNATFECALEGEPFEPCNSPRAYTALATGEKELLVQATDEAGNTDPSPASYGWTIVTPPQTAIDAGPQSSTEETSATFAFSADQPDATFECALDGGAFQSCAAPVELNDLPVGDHAFEVRAIDEAGNVDPTPATHGWTILAPPDTTAPETTLGDRPPAVTLSSGATFTFSANEPGSTFECALDGAAFVTCASPRAYTNLAGGSHEFRVRAVDPAGNADATPALHTWTVDVPPETTIDATPVDPTDSTEATFEFSADQAGSTFACAFDGAGFAPCSSPVTYTGLALGEHEFLVQATGPAGNVDPTPAEFGWDIGDTTPPVATITGGPEATTDSTEATFTFTVDDPDAVLQCSLDGAPFTLCASPKTYTGLAVGDHSFEVHGIKQHLLIDPEPALHEWTIEPPRNTPAGSNITVLADTATVTFATVETAGETTVTTLASPPAQPDGYLQLGASFYDVATTAAFSGQITICFDYEPTDFSDPDAVQLLHFENGAWTDVTSSNDPVIGRVCGEVTSLSPFGIALPVDESAPDTSIDTATPAELALGTPAVFTFSGTDNATSGSELVFECALDGGEFVGCTSPHEVTDLAVGTHAIEIRAVDLALNADPTPASYGWTVTAPPDPTPTPTPEPTPEPADTTPPTTALDAGPPDGDTTGNANFTFTANEAGATFACALDGAAFAECTSPRPYSGLAVGDHEFRVRATDVAGNTDATPATYSWTVDPAPTPPPAPNCGTEITVTANADAWIDQGSPTSNKGTDSILKVMSKSGNNNFRALVRFQLPTAPAGCEIDTATLRLYAASWKTGRTIQAIRVNGTWTENGVTWNNQPTTTGTAATTTSGSGYRTWTVTSQVQTMYDSGVNNGFLIRDATEGNDAEQQFHAREKGENPPRLVIRFKPADTTAPTTTIEATPENPTTATSASFTFAGSDNVTAPAALVFECRLNSEAFAACTSPRQLTGLTPGAYKFEVRAKDQKGNLDATPARYRWTVQEPPDTTAPETTIDAGPNGTTTSTSASFSFSASEPGSTFQCALDGGAFASCSSPTSYTGVAVGGHEVRVRATDAAGNTDGSPATYAWTVQPPPDTTAPETGIESGPANGDTTGTASFSFWASESATFTCSLDGGSFQACGSPATYGGLGIGFHEFRVRATDAAGNTDGTPASYGWNVAPPPDTTVPDTWVESGPPDGDTSGTAAFTFGASEAATFECALDGGAYQACAVGVQYSGLAPGPHTVAVRATDGAGNSDQSPALYEWTVEPPGGGGG